jgi:hypothetical protein
VEKIDEIINECKKSGKYMVLTAHVVGKADGNNILQFNIIKESFPWASIPETKRKMDELIISDLLSR